MYYITYNQLLEVYGQVLNVSGGGTEGILDKGKIEGILEQVMNNDYYPKIEDKIAYYFFAFNKYHCFIDGNKRIALAVCIHFMNINGYLYALKRFTHEMENIAIHVAAGSIDKELLKDIIYSIIYENDFSEELKIRYFEAIMNTKAP
jgi:death-on-curing protein